jgi:hypothetical protein
MAKPKVKKKAARAKKKSNVKRIPRQEVIPGMGDAKIAAIENAALDYAEIRDERQELSQSEAELKQKLMDLMHKAGKEEYKRNGIHVWIEVKEETVKVRVKATEDTDEDEEPKAKSKPEPELNVTTMPEPEPEKVEAS